MVAKATKELQEALGVELAYLMEDAIEVAEGNVPVHTWALQGQVMRKARPKTFTCD